MSIQLPGKQEDEKVPPAPPDYGAEEKPKGGWRALLTPLLIAIIVSFAMGQFFFLPQMQNQTNQAIADMKKASDEVKASVTPMQAQVTGIDNAVRSLNAETASIRGTLANYATSDKISSLQASITSLQNDLNVTKGSIPNASAISSKLDVISASVDSLRTQLTSANAQIVDLQGKVTALQTSATSTTNTTTTTGTTTTTSGAVSVSYPTGWIQLPGTTNMTNNFLLTISNGLSKDIFYGQLQLTIQYMGISPTDYPSVIPLSATGVTWQPPSVSASSLTIVGNTNFYITANSAKTITVNFNIPSPPPSGTTPYIKVTAASFSGYSQ